MASTQVEAIEAREERLYVETLVHVWLHRRLYGFFNLLGHRINYRMVDFNVRFLALPALPSTKASCVDTSTLTQLWRLGACRLHEMISRRNFIANCSCVNACWRMTESLRMACAVTLAFLLLLPIPAATFAYEFWMERQDCKQEGHCREGWSLGLRPVVLSTEILLGLLSWCSIRQLAAGGQLYTLTYGVPIVWREQSLSHSEHSHSAGHDKQMAEILDSFVNKVGPYIGGALSATVWTYTAGLSV